MAETPNGFVADRSGWTTPNQPRPLNPSKVETFVQQQRSGAADTRIGKAEEAVGGYLAKKIEQGQSSGNWLTQSYSTHHSGYINNTVNTTGYGYSRHESC